MSFAVNFPLFLVIACLVSAVVSSLLPHRAARVVSLCLTAASVAANMLLAGYLYGLGNPVTYLMGHYSHPWGNELLLTVTGAVMSACFSAILFLCLLGGGADAERLIAKGKVRYLYVLSDLVQVALLVFAYTNDIFTGYVFIEICTIASCGLLMIRENGKSILAAIRYMIFSLVGSGLFLFGVIFLYGITGQLLFPDLAAAVGTLWEEGSYHAPLLASISLITVGLAIKSGLFPFHLWMADTYGAAVPASSGILSGLVSKGYILFLIRIILDCFGTDVFYACGIRAVLYVLGACGIIIGSVGALREKDIFRMVAYSSAAQIGYVYLALGLPRGIGLTAALVQMLAHAVTKPALFLECGRFSALHGGARKFKSLWGAAHRNVFTGMAFAFGAFSMIGLPLTAGFIPKFLTGSASFSARLPETLVTLLVLAVSTILNTLYYARTVIRLFKDGPGEGEPAPEAAPAVPGAQGLLGRGETVAYRVAIVLFIMLNILLGTRAGLLMKLF